MSGSPQAGRWFAALRDGAGDLLLGAACWSCGSAGRPVCADCADELAGQPLRWAEPDPWPPGFPPTVAGADYAGVAAALIRAHKDDQAWALRSVLGDRLAAAVQGLVAELQPDPTARVVLVPLPSAASAVRRRGYDATTVLAAHAARLVQRGGRRADAVRLLRQRPGVADQAGLDARERAENLRERLVVRRRLPRAGSTDGQDLLILVDDVTTTGSTLAEGVRALAAAGHEVAGAATVAATRRRASGERTALSPATRF